MAAEPIPNSQTPAAAGATGPGPAPAETEGRQRIWRLLLLGAALLVAAETVIANRGWRGTAPTAAPQERNRP